MKFNWVINGQNRKINNNQKESGKDNQGAQTYSSLFTTSGISKSSQINNSKPKDAQMIFIFLLFFTSIATTFNTEFSCVLLISVTDSFFPFHLKLSATSFAYNKNAFYSSIFHFFNLALHYS